MAANADGQDGTLRARIIATLFALILPVALLAPLGLSPLGILIALTVLGLTWKDRPWRRGPRWLPVLLALLTIYALVSTTWTPDARVGFKGGLQITGTAIAIWMLVGGLACLRRGELARVARWSLAGLAVSVAILLVDRLMDQALIGWVHHMAGSSWRDFARAATKRGVTVAVIAVWPLAMLLDRRGAVAAFALAAAAVALGHSSTALVALVAGSVGAGVAWLAARRTGLGLAAALVAFILAAPWVVLQLPEPQPLWDRAPWIPNSLHHRLTIWRFAADHIAERPLLGWGMEASRVIPGGDDTILVRRDYGVLSTVHHEALLPLHPHSMAIQWWLELGAVGAGLCAALVAMACLAAGGRRDRVLAALSLGMILSVATASASAFGAWQSWWLLALGMTSALAAAAPDPRKES